MMAWICQKHGAVRDGYACPKCELSDLRAERDALRAELAAALKRVEELEREKGEKQRLTEGYCDHCSPDWTDEFHYDHAPDCVRRT